MLVQIEVNWQLVQGGAANAFGTYVGTGTAFDTDTHTIVSYQSTASGSYLGGGPAAVHTAAGAIIWYECDAAYTKTSWIYDGAGGFTTTTDANSLDCGWTPPLTCDLGTASVTQTPTAGGATLKFVFDGTLNGQAYYSLDAGAEQTSPTFINVPVGEHSLQLRDAGLKDCVRTVEVEIRPAVVAPALPAVPIGPSQGIDFVGQPLWFPLAGQPVNALVELEVWAESAQGADDFALVLPLRKRVDKQGRVNFRLDTLLWPLLSPFVPTPGLPTSLCTTNLVNYYVRTTTTVTDQAPVVAISPLRTALRGGLPAEWQGTDYFAFRLGGGLFPLPRFLSWQPLGPGHSAGGLAKPVVFGQPDWLFFLCPLGLTDAELVVRRAYFVTDTAAPIEEVEVLTRPAGRGWAQRLLAIPLRATHAGVASMSVRLQTAAGVVVSQEARYSFVAATDQTRYLLFTNSLGAVDTVRCEGRLEVTLDAVATQAERPPRYGETAPAADRQLSDLSASRKLKLATGWLEPEALAWLQELVLTREAWHQVGPQLRPLDLAKRTLIPYSDALSLRGLLLECDYAYAPTAYAPSSYS